MGLTQTGKTSETFSIATVVAEMQALDFDSLSQSKQISRLKTYIEKYVRLAKMRDMTSFSRSEGRTEGGRQEGPAQDVLINLRNEFLTSEAAVDEATTDKYVNALLVMADISPTPDELPIFMARLLHHGAQVVDPYALPANYIYAVRRMWRAIRKSSKDRSEDLQTLVLLDKAKAKVSASFGITL